MKKLFLALLILPIITFINANTDKQLEAAKNFKAIMEKESKWFNDPEYLKFILGNKLDLHFYGVLTPIIAKERVKEIHNNLTSELKNKKNHLEAGKSLIKTPDAIIINTCATIEQRLRKDGKAGMISGSDYFFGESSIARYLRSSQFDGTKFFETGCDCDFYKNLTAEQLEQLRKGTHTNK